MKNYENNETDYFQTCIARLLPVGVASQLHSAVSHTQVHHSVSSLLKHNNNKSTAELQYYCSRCWVSTHCTHCTAHCQRNICSVFLSQCEWMCCCGLTDSRWVCELHRGENEALPGDMSGDLLRLDWTWYVWFHVNVSAFKTVIYLWFWSHWFWSGKINHI